MNPDAVEERAVNRFVARRAVVTALLLTNLAGGIAAVIARANTSGDPAPAAPKTATTTTIPAATPAVSGPLNCGQGSASARAVLIRTEEAYDLNARVTNETDRPIEIDSLLVRAVYADGVKELALPTDGLRVETGSRGAGVSFPVPDGRSATRPSSFEIAQFRFHPADQPECMSH